MKLFKALALVCLLFFFVGCEESIKKLGPEDEAHDGGSDVTDDSDGTDPTNPTDDPTNPTTDPTDDPTDDPTNPTTDPTDDPTEDPTDDDDSIDPTNPTNDTDDPTDDDDSTDPTNDNDNPLTDQEKCVAAGGIWDDFAESYSEICYKIVNCKIPEGENAEYMIWLNGESYTMYYDFENSSWVGETYDTEYNDSGNPEICQYICASNARREDDKCKPICSAVFDGTSSKVIVQNNERLNLGNSWTIEAWIKQDMNDLTTKENYIARKGSRSYYLGGFYKSTEGGIQKKTYYNMEGGFYYALSQYVEDDITVESKYQNTDANSPITNGWNHVALSSYIKDGNTYIRLYINGKLAKGDSDNKERTPKTVSDDLTIGYYSESGIGGGIIEIGGSESYFKGQIDQLKISENYYEDEFTPSQLSVDSKTIALYDFNGNTKDSSPNTLDGSGTNVTDSTDCAF